MTFMDSVSACFGCWLGVPVWCPPLSGTCVYIYPVVTVFGIGCRMGMSLGVGRRRARTCVTKSLYEVEMTMYVLYALFGRLPSG